VPEAGIVDRGAHYRVALIGLGRVGRLHLSALRQVARAEIVALVDPFVPDLDDVASAAGVRPYADAATMLEAEKPDIVCVLAPALRHAELVALCAGYCAHVLCEKPLALNTTEAVAMIDACRDANVRLFYGASYRFLPALRAAHALIGQGAIGQPILMTESILCGSGPTNRDDMGPAHYPAGGPGGSGWGLVDHGIHLIDAFAWLSRSPITNAFGRGNISGETAGLEFVVARHANGAMTRLTYDDGTYPASLPGEGIFSEGAAWDQAGLVEAGGWSAQPQNISIYGTKGSLRIFHYANALFLRDRNGLRKIPLDGPAPNSHFATQFEAVLHDLDDGGMRMPRGEDGLQALNVLEAVYRSMKSDHMEKVACPRTDRAGATSDA
jgi:predicted dehydrogenase